MLRSFHSGNMLKFFLYLIICSFLFSLFLCLQLISFFKKVHIEDVLCVWFCSRQYTKQTKKILILEVVTFQIEIGCFAVILYFFSLSNFHLFEFFFFLLEDSSTVSSKSFIKVFVSAIIFSVFKGSLLFHEFISLFISLRMFLIALMFSLARIISMPINVFVLFMCFCLCFS